jgi:hypothetical protein
MRASFSLLQIRSVLAEYMPLREEDEAGACELVLEGAPTEGADKWASHNVRF